MKINILGFAIVKEIIGKEKMTFEFSGNSVGDLKKEMCEKYEAFNKLASIRFAVNEEYQNDDFILKQNDEVAIIPPVAGG